MRNAVIAAAVWTILMAAVLILALASPDDMAWVAAFAIVGIWVMGVVVGLLVLAVIVALRERKAVPVAGTVCGRCGRPQGWTWRRCEHCKASYAEYPPIPKPPAG